MAKYLLAVVVMLGSSLCSIRSAAQSLGNLVNFHIGHDHSEELLNSQYVPQKVKEILEQSVGPVLLVQQDWCKGGGECDDVEASGTAFVIGDHLVAAPFHLFEKETKNPSGAGIVSSLLKEKNPRRGLRLYFGGRVYSAELLNNNRIHGVDLALLRVGDPDHTFNFPVITFAERDVPRGVQPLFTRGFYGGCTKEDFSGDKDIFCVTPGTLIFYVVNGSVAHDDTFGENPFVLMGASALGFSGSPLLNAKGECIGISLGYWEDRLEAYFLSVMTIREFFENVRTTMPQVVNAALPPPVR